MFANAAAASRPAASPLDAWGEAAAEGWVDATVGDLVVFSVVLVILVILVVDIVRGQA